MVDSSLKCTVKFGFAPEERDVYSLPVLFLLHKLRRSANRTFACIGNGSDAGFRSYRRSFGYILGAINISPRWGEATNKVLMHFQLEFAS